MNEGEKINAIHALQNVLNPRSVANERVEILDKDQLKIVADKMIEIVKSLTIKAA